jgi:hypothetical protein
MRFPILFLLAIGLFACGDDPASNGDGDQPGASNQGSGEDESPAAGPGTRVKVQHVLISWGKAPGFAGGGGQSPVPPRALKRKKPTAEKLANDVLSRAKGGFDFTSLVRAYSDDKVQPGSTDPGIYVLVDGGSVGPDEFARKNMVKGFGDLAFSLEVGGIGMCPFDAVDSPFGWHIIVRIE